LGEPDSVKRSWIATSFAERSIWIVSIMLWVVAVLNLDCGDHHQIAGALAA